MPYTTIMISLAAIIPVAGLSSRMGSFKPLIKLNGFPMIEITAGSAIDGGVQTVCIVTGHNAGAVRDTLRDALTTSQTDVSSVVGLEEPLQPLNPMLFFAHNLKYDKSDMFSSVQLGLQTLLDKSKGQVGAPRPHAVFVLPGDMPGINPRIYAALGSKWQETRPAVLVPRYDGRCGHPLLVSSECFEAVLAAAADGHAGGLREVLADFEWARLDVDDPGILLDANTPETLVRLEQHIQKTRGVSEAIAEEFFALHGTPSNVHDHTRAVAQLARRMAKALNPLGFGLDSELCRSGGELHDLARLKPHHSKVAATFLRELGYEALSHVVGTHDHKLDLKPTLFTEANLVFVADKLIKETTLVSIERRYEGALKRFLPETPIGALIQKDCRNSLALLEQYVQLTGDSAVLQGTGAFRKKDRGGSSGEKLYNYPECTLQESEHS